MDRAVRASHDQSRQSSGLVPSRNPALFVACIRSRLIVALVCGTAGLPHILVRFYTNPDGIAAKKTTMWVMILIGVFYVFPPVFGVLGRNFLPELYEASGSKGPDKVVLELPILIREKYGIWVPS
jgi:cation/acetate symporter